MKRLALAMVLLIAQFQVRGADLDQCPVLPKNSNLRWHFVHDALQEYDVCYATERGSDVQVFGFYFSKTAAVFMDNPEPIESGTIAGREVTWFGPNPALSIGPFSRHATIAPDERSRSFILVYVYADNEQQLQSRLQTLRDTKMKRYGVP